MNQFSLGCAEDDDFLNAGESKTLERPFEERDVCERKEALE